MFKNLTGGSTIGYGAALPDNPFDGTLFLKTGTSPGLYVYGFTQDANVAVAGDQSTQDWIRVLTDLYLPVTGGTINGALAVAGGGSYSDPYGQMSVTMPSNATNYGYYGLTRQGQIGWSIGVDSSNRLFFGSGASIGLNVASRPMTLDPSGGLQINGNTVWHAGNDGAGSGLDADLLDGQSSAFFQNAANLTGTLDQARLPFQPVQQGGGTGQASNKVYIGWSGGGQLLVQVDSTNFGGTWPISVTGNAATANFANSATNATNATNANYATSAGSVAWTNVSGRPTALSSFTNDPGYLTSVSWGQISGRPTSLNAFTNDPGYLTSVAWAQVSGRPTSLNSFTNDPGFTTAAASNAAYLSRATGTWITSADGMNRFHFSSNGNTNYWANGTHVWFNNGGATTMTLDTNGYLWCSGNITAFSDVRLKKDIEPIPGALDKVKALNGVTYTRIETGLRETGLIAQDVQKVLPEAVVEQVFDGMLSVAYGNMVGLLVESIKELSAKVDEMKKEIETLRVEKQ